MTAGMSTDMSAGMRPQPTPPAILSGPAMHAELTCLRARSVPAPATGPVLYRQ